MLYDCNRIPHRIDRRLSGLAGPDYDATISSGLPLEPEDSQYGKSRSILVTTNLPFDEWTEVLGSERLTGALLDRLTHRVHILEMNGESYRLRQSKTGVVLRPAGSPTDT